MRGYRSESGSSTGRRQKNRRSRGDHPSHDTAPHSGSAAAPDVDLGFAHVDVTQMDYCGIPEVVYGSGKTTEQVIGIIRALRAAGQPVLVTRANPALYRAVRRAMPAAVYHPVAKTITLGVRPRKEGLVVVVSAGTADIPVAEEAAVTAEYLGARVERIYDVGVAGLHRVLRHIDLIRRARAVVVVAGMEGALPSVVGGLVDVPLIAVPTSVGYGASLQGLAALLTMLNSCVPGLAVVNIDNGFGAGVLAARINRMPNAAKERESPPQTHGQAVAPVPVRRVPFHKRRV